MKKSHAPTMKDVAREADVALGTVSKVVNGLPVGIKYKRKVEQAIASLGYEVNTYARGLKTQRTKTIALIIPDTRNPFYAAFTHHIESATYKRGYKLILCCSNNSPEKEIEYLSLASQSKTDGIIALTYSDIGNYIPVGIPLVAFDRYFENAAIPRISSDNFSGGMQAVGKLLELGCKKLIFVRNHSRFPGEADKRMQGYLEACKKYNLVPDYLDELECDDNESKKSVKQFITDRINPDGTLGFDGVFANTDYYGYMILKILQELGYQVPDDVQIIGFDGISKFGAEEGDLFVSSICQPIPELAELCIDTILNEDNRVIPSLSLLPVYYRWGGTTKKENQ